MATDLITDIDSVITFCLADASAISDTIDRDDTVRYTGKRQTWIVNAVRGDMLTVWTSTKRGRNTSEVTRTVHRDRVELVRKGNDIDDYIAAYDANGGTSVGLA